MIERGRIVRVTGSQVWVEVAAFGVGQQLGPCEVLSGTPVVGARCVVAAVHDSTSDVVVLGVLP